MKTLAILTNGGDTCALNASIKSIRDNAYRAGYKKIYGIRRGYQGLIDGWIDDITLREIDPRIGGSCLGSMRTSPTDRCVKVKRRKMGELYEINDERCRKMAQCLSDYRIDVLIVIGGDGTLQSTKMFQDWVNQERAASRYRPFQIIGFLKTIDNDIRTFTNFEGIQVSLCPGFPSAATKIVASVEDLRVTARTAERAFSVETMGRDAGWLAAAAVFGGAEILLVPEHMEFYKSQISKEKEISDFEASRQVLCQLVDEIASFYERNRNVIIAVAEGFEPETKIEAVKDFVQVIQYLYGPRKKVGATELVAMIVSPVLEYYFWCLSELCGYQLGSPDLQREIGLLMDNAIKQQEGPGKRYREKVLEAQDHPLQMWDVKKRLCNVLGLENEEPEEPTNPRATTPSIDATRELDLPSAEGERTADRPQKKVRTPLSLPPFKFEIRPHRTDYLPRSGPPSAYDYKLATVLGQKVGQMLLPENREFGAVPALEQVVPYEQLSQDVIKTVQIDEIRTLRFDSLDYFDENIPLQVSERIIGFFRTILSGPEELEQAIAETKA